MCIIDWSLEMCSADLLRGVALEIRGQRTPSRVGRDVPVRPALRIHMPGLAGPRQHCRSHPEPCRVERQPDTLTTQMRNPVAVQPLQLSRMDIVKVKCGLIPFTARGLGHEKELVHIRATAK